MTTASTPLRTPWRQPFRTPSSVPGIPGGKQDVGPAKAIAQGLPSQRTCWPDGVAGAVRRKAPALHGNLKPIVEFDKFHYLLT